jgi:hypothetical protein
MPKRPKPPQPSPDGPFAIGTRVVLEKLERLQALATDHFETGPDGLDWGHVGTLREIEQLVTAALEHAESLAGHSRICRATAEGRGQR